MKRLLILLAGCLGLAGAATAQGPSPGGAPYPPGYGYAGPGTMPGPGFAPSPGGSYPPGYPGPGGMPMPGMMGGGMPMPGMMGGGMPMPGMMGGGMPMQPSPEMNSPKKAYGWNSGIRKFFSSKECASCGDKKSGCFQMSKVKPAPMPPAQGGTLAFPHHPYVRGPRDFFQQD